MGRVKLLAYDLIVNGAGTPTQDIVTSIAISYGNDVTENSFNL
jgi:2,3-bisphosphoglycerate-independent phosphoglycerate mutase